MCLTTLSRKPKPRPGIGWKTYELRGGRLFPYVRDEGKSLPMGVWLDSRKYGSIREILSDHDRPYPAGWHLYDSGFEYMQWKDCARYVKFKGILCHGKDGPDHVIVARYVMIMPKRWKPKTRKRRTNGTS